MRTDIPVFKRCCGCVPLRYGLIVWGYLRLLFAAFIIFNACCAIIWLSQRDDKTNETKHKVILSLLIPLLITDIILGIVFIVGCHKKDATLITKYYHYNQFLLGILLPLGIYNFINEAYYITHSSMRPGFIVLDLVFECISCLTYVVIQIYIMMLVRSEISKLNNDCQFRFENRVPAAEFSLNIEGSNEGRATNNNKKHNNEDIENNEI